MQKHIEHSSEGLDSAELRNEVFPKAVHEFFDHLAKNQRPLPPEFAKVLHDNLWELYEGEVIPNPQIETITLQRDELLAACKYVLEDDGLIPRAHSACRAVVRAAVAKVEA